MGFLSNVAARYRSAKRYNQIIRVLFRYGFEDLVQYMEEHKRYSFIRKLIPKSTKRHAVVYTKWEKMRMVCEELGPTFVKFGQIMSNRPDLVPMDLIIELEKLQDNVPPMPEKIAKQVVEHELDGRVEDLFAWFEPEPFASASMAQVHKATLHTGERAALKIQRPGITEMIKEDIKVMYFVAEVLVKRMPSIKSFDPVGLVKNFEKSILQELDFINESINIQRFRMNLESDKAADQYATAPKVFVGLTTSKVLALEFMSGTKISWVHEFEEKGLERKEMAKRLAISYFKQIFEYGFFHADPHPGNLLVLTNGKVCYLDFGMMGSILNRDMEILGQLFIAIRNKDIKKIILALQRLSNYTPIENMRELEFDINEFIERYYVRAVEKSELSTLLLELKDIIVKHDLTVPSHFYLFIRSMVTVEGVVEHLDPDLDQFDLVKPFLIKTVARKFSPYRIGKKVINSVYEITNYMEEFPRDLKNAIRKINKGEVKVNLSHQGIDPMVHTFLRISKQIASSMIIAALLVSSTLFVISDIPPLYKETSVWGLVGFVFAIIIAYKMIRDYRKGDHDNWDGWSKKN